MNNCANVVEQVLLNLQAKAQTSADDGDEKRLREEGAMGERKAILRALDCLALSLVAKGQALPLLELRRVIAGGEHWADREAK